MVTIILVILYVFKWPLSPKDRFNQRERGLNPLQLLIDGRRKPIDEKMQDTAHACIAWESFCSACVKRKFPTFSISSIGETLPEKFFNTKVTLSM